MNSKRKQCQFCKNLFHKSGLRPHEIRCRENPEMINKESLQEFKAEITALIICNEDGPKKGFLINGSHLEEINLEIIKI